MSIKLKQKEVVAQLREHLKQKSVNATKSEIAQDMQKETKKAEVAKAEIKTRDVKDFIVVKNEEQLDSDSRQVIKERRSYMLDTVDSEHAEVYNATLYTNAETQKVELLTQKIANDLVQKFVSSLKYSDRFVAQDIMRKLQTKGGAYGDKVRNALFNLSIYVTQAQMNSDIEAVIARAKSVNKSLIRFNTIEDSRRIKYEFIKIV